MTVLSVPALEEEPWPTLGPQITEFMEEYLVFGPGDLLGQPAVVDDDWGALIDRMYEVWRRAPRRIPLVDKRGRRRHADASMVDLELAKEMAGRRRFKRVVISRRKGTAKTEKGGGWITACELHPNAPVRTVAWGYRGDPNAPEGSGVPAAYIPMVAYSEEQTEEQSFGALYAVLSESPLVNDFDIGYERIMCVRGNGKAEPRASSPNARDGSLTSFQPFDETHRWILPRLKRTHQTMLRNIPKRYAADAWSLETTTAFVPGEASVAEASFEYARAVAEGRTEGKDFFFFHEQASDKWDLSKPRSLRSAIIEAAPLAAEWSDINAIANQWDDPQSDPAYLEQVWLNRPTQASRMAFDTEAWKRLGEARRVVELAGANAHLTLADDTGEPLKNTEGHGKIQVIIRERSIITLGFDGSRYEAGTGIVATDMVSGYQWKALLCERPLEPALAEGWEVPRDEVDAVVEFLFGRYRVFRMFADKWGWDPELRDWQARFGPEKFAGKAYERILAFDMKAWAKRAVMERDYANAILSGEVTHDGDAEFTAHIGNARKKMLSIQDSDGRRLWVTTKERPDSPMNIDLAQCGALSWRARQEGVALGLAKVRGPRLPLEGAGPLSEPQDDRRRREGGPVFSGLRGKEF